MTAMSILYGSTIGQADTWLTHMYYLLPLVLLILKNTYCQEITFFYQSIFNMVSLLLLEDDFWLLSLH